MTNGGAVAMVGYLLILGQAVGPLVAIGGAIILAGIYPAARGGPGV